VDAALAKRDLLIAPTTPIAAMPLDAVTPDSRSALLRLTRPFNFSGHPAASVPCGFTGDGMPIGMQIVGRPFDEVTIFRAADAWQRATDWHTRRPPVGGGETA
jgi:aspartyl-tRNA(Asn)/glutamyl-tRNA(Gln) amidotransferase subunit A